MIDYKPLNPKIMKLKFFFFVLLFLSSVMAKAQDIIYKVDGGEISAKVLEIDETVVKYKNFDQQDGPIRSISKKNVFLIIYENGKREKFETNQTIDNQQNTRSNENTPTNASVNNNSSAEKQIKTNRLTLEYVNLKIEKNLSTVKVGKGLFYAGGIIAVVGFIDAVSGSSSGADYGGIMIAGGSALWLTGIIVWVVAESRVKYFEQRKFELSINLSRPIQYIINKRSFQSPQLGLTIRF